jgi:hypothetical protein
MLGCAVSGPGIAANTYISVYTSSSSMTLSAAAGAGFGSGTCTFGVLATTTGTTAFTSATGQTWNVGGALLTMARAMVTASGIHNCYSAGDSIYLGGGGTWAETVANTLSGSAIAPLSVIGDVDGAKTGDAGQVVLSAFTSGNTSAPSSTILMALAATTNISFSLITFVQGGAYAITSTAAAAAANYTFTDCTFNTMYFAGTIRTMNFLTSTTGLAFGLTVDRCTFLANVSGAAIYISAATTASGSADFDLLCVIRNCLIIGGASATAGVFVVASGTSTYKAGGVRVYDCTIITGGISVELQTATYLSTTIPCEVHNNLLTGGVYAGTAGQLTGDHNVIYSNTPQTNYTYGTGDVSNTVGTGTYKAPLVELGQSVKWAGVLRQFLAPDGAASPLLGAGSATFSGNYPTVDWSNRPRPSGGGSASAAVGYSEFHDFAKQDTVVYPVGQTSSGKMTGPGDCDIWVPVDAVSTTIAIQLYQGSGYTGSTYATATIEANGEIGVALATQTCTSTLSSWQTLTFGAISPTAAGWVKVRVTSFDTSGTGTLNFGALTAT